MNNSHSLTTTSEPVADVTAESLAYLELPEVLKEVALHAQSVPGKGEVLRAVPEGEVDRIQAQLDLVSELVEMIGLQDSLGLNDLLPMEGILSKLENKASILDSEEILAVADVLAVAAVVQDKLAGLDARFEILRRAAAGFRPLDQLRNRMAEVLDEHGLVRTSASRRLAEIRERSRAMRRRIHGTLENVVNDKDLSRVVQEDYVTLRNDRYVILLRPEFKGLLHGIVHDHSRSGASVYVEPLDVVELNNKVASLMDEEREEVRRIFKELTDKTRSFVPEISANYNLLTRLDAFQARALYALRTRSISPELVDEGFRILSARHPLLPEAGEDAVVPMDVIQGASTRASVISGANMGGKTVALKIAGLFPLMVRCGIMAPAREGTEINPFNRIMADIGDEQDIRSRVSSFSGHMQRIKAIIDQASHGDLVLLDELGGATDPAEGSALAMGIMDELINRGARVVVTTHLTHLKAYALGREEVKNVSVEFHPETLKPTFALLYDLPGESHAIMTAERMGIPARVIDAARRYVEKGAGGTSRLISMLREKISETERLERELAAKQRDMEKELAQIRMDREEIVEGFRKEARGLIRGAEKEIAELQRSLKRGRLKEPRIPREELTGIKAELERGLGRPLEPELTRPRVGAMVKVKTLGKAGIVRALLDNEQVELTLGNMKIRADLDDVVILDQHVGKKSSSKKEQIRIDIPLATPRREVNVIGLRVDEAIPVVDRAIDDAVLGGLSSLNIIHGKGTGRLKQAIRDHLSSHSLVRSFCVAELHMGGEGVTVVDLEGG